MGKDASYLLHLDSGFWQIGIVDDQTNRLPAFDRVTTHYYFTQKLPVDAVEKLAPIDGTIYHEAIKNILLARQNLGKC